MPVRLLHLADLHLGATFRMLGLREAEREADLFDAFQRAVDFALDPAHRIDAVLVAGDVFDVHDPDLGLVSRVKAQTRRLADAHVPVFWIPGTHDRYDDPACVYRHDDFPGVTLLTDPRYGEPQRVTLGDTPVAISGCAYQAGLSSAEPLADLPDLGEEMLHVALLHGSVQENLEWTVRDHYVPIKPGALRAAPVHYLALGHYHNAREWPTSRGVAYYPGTLEGRRFGENGPRFLTVVELEHGAARPRIETHPWNRRTLCDVELDFDIAGFDDVEGSVAWMRERADADTILRVTLKGSPGQQVDVAALHATVAPACFHLDVRDETEVFNTTWIAMFAEEASVRGEFVRRLQTRLGAATAEERPVFAQALRLGVQAFAGHERNPD